MAKASISNVFKIAELRKKMLITIALLALYRFGSYLPIPGIPFSQMLAAYKASSNTGALAVLNLFSGGALSRMAIFSLGVMPYITAQIIFQMMQTVTPTLKALAEEGEAGQQRITQYTRYLTVGLSLVSAVGYVFLFKSPTYGMDFSYMGVPELFEEFLIVLCLVAGSIIIMWIGEVITQRGIGNGMSLIIFANIMAGVPPAIAQSLVTEQNPLMTVLMLLVIVAVIPAIVYIERGQRRIPVQYSKRVIGRRMMGGQSTYLPIKVNTAGVVPIIFASAILYMPAQISVFLPGVQWLADLSTALATGWISWVAQVVLIVFFAYFYTEMVFDPEDTADNLRKAGGFIPGVRPGRDTAEYIRDIINHITLPGALFMAALAVAPSIIFSFTNNLLIQSFGGTSVLIMVGVAMDTLASVESQVQTHNYDGFFR